MLDLFEFVCYFETMSEIVSLKCLFFYGGDIDFDFRVELKSLYHIKI